MTLMRPNHGTARNAQWENIREKKVLQIVNIATRGLCHKKVRKNVTRHAFQELIVKLKS
jgi:hypothetical protein